MNILLVDDDRFVIAALEKNIDWESLGITTVFTANDIGKAMEELLDFDRTLGDKYEITSPASKYPLESMITVSSNDIIL